MGVNLIKKKAVFFDRDGVLIKPKFIKNVPHAQNEIKKFCLYKNVKKNLEMLKNKNFLTIVITNQPDYQKGLIKKIDIIKTNSLLKKKLKFTDFFTCYESNDASFMKKPNPGMLFKAAAKYHLSLKNSFFIGDTIKDMIAGKRAKCKTILLEKKYNYNARKCANFICKNISDATKLILEKSC